MALNLWDRAKAEQLTRRGERFDSPARVQRLTDTLHLCRVAGESAEIAIRSALQALTPRADDAPVTDWTAKRIDPETARAILQAWIDQHGQTTPRSRNAVCLRCDGTGTRSGGICPWCDGTGHLP